MRPSLACQDPQKVSSTVAIAWVATTMATTTPRMARTVKRMPTLTLPLQLMVIAAIAWHVTCMFFLIKIREANNKGQNNRSVLLLQELMFGELLSLADGLFLTPYDLRGQKAILCHSRYPVCRPFFLSFSFPTEQLLSQE